jgi:hypothetical protein
VWTVGTINSAASATLTVTARMATSGAKTNTAEVTAADQTDIDSTPNNHNAAEDDQASVTVMPPVTIGNFVWSDLNGNGLQDAGEPGINGVAVKLFKCDNTQAASTTTTGGGLYQFSNLAPGCYYVKFTTPSGFTASLANVGANDSVDSDGTTTGQYTLASGDNNTTVDAGFVAACATSIFDLSGGNSPMSGTAGNFRTYTTVDGVSVKATAFSRTDSGGAWSTAYLGAYSPGLGVTDTSEGNGSGNRHKVDNIGGRNNYMLFEFSSPVVISRTYLDYLGTDSDMSVWVGTKTDPFNNHLTLSDAMLSSLGARQDDTTTTTAGARWSTSVNGAKMSGNVLVISALQGGTNDEFKISKLDRACR